MALIMGLDLQNQEEVRFFIVVYIFVTKLRKDITATVYN